MNIRFIIGIAVFIIAVTCFLSFAPPADAQAIMELDAIVVEGRIQRPQATYIINRASADFGIQAKRRSFVDKIVVTIEKEPF